MKKTDRATAKTNTGSQDAFTAHMQYASKTVASWPSWKQNILAHTRPAQDNDSIQAKSQRDEE